MWKSNNSNEPKLLLEADCLIYHVEQKKKKKTKFTKIRKENKEKLNLNYRKSLQCSRCAQIGIWIWWKSAKIPVLHKREIDLGQGWSSLKCSLKAIKYLGISYFETFEMKLSTGMLRSVRFRYCTFDTLVWPPKNPKKQTLHKRDKVIYIGFKSFILIPNCTEHIKIFTHVELSVFSSAFSSGTAGGGSCAFNKLKPLNNFWTSSFFLWLMIHKLWTIRYGQARIKYENLT